MYNACRVCYAGGDRGHVVAYPKWIASSNFSRNTLEQVVFRVVDRELDIDEFDIIDAQAQRRARLSSRNCSLDLQTVYRTNVHTNTSYTRHDCRQEQWCMHVAR
jgi:hypothetical protein